MNPYVFLVGCPRSGTTLLRRLADAHRQLAVMPEQHWLPNYWDLRVGVSKDGHVTSDLLDVLLADRRFELLDLPFRPLADLVENGPPITYAAFVTAVADLYGERQGKRLVGEKTPRYAVQLETLHRLWPSARVVHLVRDGRDVGLSLLAWDKAERNVGRFPTWDEDPVSTAALFWEWMVRGARDVGRRLGPERYMELRYEALVDDPERACHELCRFLDLPYDPLMLRFHEGRTRAAEPGVGAKKAWLPVTAGLRSWRDQMAPGDLARFEALAGPLLAELGYDVAAPTNGSRAADASRLRERFVAHLVRWGRRVPAASKKVAA